MSVNLLKRVRGPAIIKRNGQSFFTKNASVLETALNPFKVTSDAYGVLANRHNQRLLSLQFTPVGVWNQAQLDVLYPFRNFRFGQYNTPVLTVSGVDTGDDLLLVLGHGLISGSGVRLGKGRNSAVFPTGITENQLYYVHAASVDTITLHNSEADGISGANPVDITDAGSGSIKLIVNSPLVVHTFDGVKLTIHNAACVEQPGLKLTSVDSPFGQTKYEGYAIHGSNWDDDNSLYTITEEELTVPSLDPADIPTVPYTIDWGNILAGIESREAVDLSFPMELGEISGDKHGVMARTIQAVNAQVQFIPINQDEQDLLAQLSLQGEGAARGKDLPVDVLNIYGPGNNPYIRIYGAALTNMPTNYGTNEDRIGQLTFMSQRTFAGGSANPVFYIGTDVPA